jgi:cytochrome c-type biogenesis protein CcmH
MSTRKVLLAVSLALLIGLAVAAVAYAQQPTPSDDQVNAIARQLYCPVCENIPLDVCPTTACAQWRELIRQKLADGWTEQQIKDYFVQQYGDRVLGTPPARGINLLVYLIPPLALVAGVYVLFRAYHSWKRPIPDAGATLTPGHSPGEVDASQDEYVRRMEEELRKQK